MITEIFLPLGIRKRLSTKGFCKREDLKSFSPAFRQVYRDYWAGAVKQGREFSLTPVEVDRIFGSHCHYCGLPPQTESKYRTVKNITYNGLDRVDNGLGYVAGNVVPCCRFCNGMKSALPVDVFLGHIQRVSEHQGR